MTRSERHEKDARQVEATLRAEGRAAEAEAIAAVCRSLVSMRQTASRLHADNMALRETHGASCCFCGEGKQHD
jgi:hypothetical protein